VLCPAGSTCTVPDSGFGFAACTPVVRPALGSHCASDTDCPGTGVCLINSIPLSTASTARAGICVQPCTPGTICPGAEQQACQTFKMPMDAGQASFCLPPSVATPCTSDAPCASQGLVCTLFDHAAPPLGPVGFCADPLDGGAAESANCVSSPTSGQEMCANGLCLPQNAAAGQPATCATLCASSSDCPVGDSCVYTEFVNQGAVVRHVPACVHTPTQCQACTGPTTCGPDAPHCVQGTSTLRCVSACTSPTGDSPSCPPGSTCTGGYCIPSPPC
jgi:hypothetical protein